MNDDQKQRVREIAASSPSYAGVAKRAYSGKSKAAGIKAKCLDCSCWQRIEITNCTALACPLWPYRPYQERPTPEKTPQP